MRVLLWTCLTVAGCHGSHLDGADAGLVQRHADLEHLFLNRFGELLNFPCALV